VPSRKISGLSLAWPRVWQAAKKIKAGKSK